MKHLKTKQIAVVMAAMLGTVGAVETASADVLATSIVELNGLMFTDENGNQFTQGQEISIISAVNSSNGTNATLNGVSETMSGVNVNAPGTIDLPTDHPGGTFSSSAGFDGNPDLCVGTPCSQPDNSFTNTINSSATGDPSSDVAFADELLVGAAVIFPGVTGGATVSVESTSMLTGNGAGSALTENGLIADFRFTVEEDTKFFVDFDASAYMETYVSTDVTAPDDTGNAFGQRSISFTLIDDTTGETVLQWSPNGNGAIGAGVSIDDPFDLNTSISRSEIANGAVAGGAVGVVESGRFFAGTEDLLVAGNLYHLTASQKVSVNSKQNVPEPSVIALLGMGLLGFAFKKRKV